MKCSVPGCSSGYKKGARNVSFHGFPKDLNQREQWKIMLKIPLVDDTMKVCSLHFQAEDYKVGRRNKIPKLSDTALPLSHSDAHSSLISCEDEIGVGHEVEHQLIAPECVFPQTPQTQGWEDGSAISAPILDSRHTIVSGTIMVCVNPEHLPKLFDFKSNIPSPNAIDPPLPDMLSTVENLPCTRKESAEVSILKRKVRNLQKQLSKKNAVIKKFKAKVKIMQRQVKENAEAKEIFDNLNELEKHIFKHRVSGKRPRSYPPVVKRFALNASFYSPKTYNYVRSQFPKCFPHSSTMGRWLKNVDGDPGFSQDAFVAISKAQDSCTTPLFIQVSLDEMSIRHQTEWHNGRVYGVVDCGIKAELMEQQSQPKKSQLATEVLVFLAVCINGTWKIPLGYFPCHNLTGEQKHHLLQMCLSNLIETGVVVTGVVADGATSNLKMYKFLGCEIKYPTETTTFFYNGQEIAAYPDPIHGIKNIRNALGDRKILLDGNGGVIRWQIFKDLTELQEKEELHLANKMRRGHINFRLQKMKVKLATQIFSNSIADALECLQNEAPEYVQFQNCDATINFVRIINDALDITNSRSVSCSGFKQALCPANFSHIQERCEEIIDYISKLQLDTGQLVVESQRSTGFLQIIFALKNTQFIYKIMVENHGVPYLPCHRLHQDHIELFFSACRSSYGWNNNPSVTQFKHSYIRLISHCQIRHHGLGNCLTLDEMDILHVTSTPLKNINNSVSNRRSESDDVAERVAADKAFEEEELSEMDSAEHMLNIPLLSTFAEIAVNYIAGFVVQRLLKAIQCEQCNELLEGELDIRSLIFYKSRGYLKYPSDSVRKIVKITERVLRVFDIHDSETYEKIRRISKQELMQENLFPEDSIRHSLLHKSLLLDAIMEKYLKVRFHFIHKNSKPQMSTRQWNTHLPLFRGH